MKRQLEQARRELAVARDACTRGETAGARPIEQAKTWTEAAALLPQPDGAPDWVAAMKEGVISPRAGPEAATPLQAALTLDVEREPPSDPTYNVVFHHETHTAWLSCMSCHPGIFEMKRGATPISMDLIGQRKACGVCHGTVAFSADLCTRCHTAMEQ